LQFTTVLIVDRDKRLVCSALPERPPMSIEEITARISSINRVFELSTAALNAFEGRGRG
jgi:hypothetical protein